MTTGGAALGAGIDAWLNGSDNMSAPGSGGSCRPQKGAGGKGWRGDRNWRDLVKNIEKGGDVDLAIMPRHQKKRGEQQSRRPAAMLIVLKDLTARIALAAIIILT
jgi:hypothetical protein